MLLDLQGHLYDTERTVEPVLFLGELQMRLYRKRNFMSEKQPASQVSLA